jgi:hypothetical protein
VSARSDITKHGAGGAVLAFALGALMVLPGCASREAQVRFDGVYYPAKVNRDRENLDQFRVKVNRVSRGLEGALAAGDYEAKRYCLKTHGTSDIEWINGPESDNPRALIKGGRLAMNGKCVTW